MTRRRFLNSKHDSTNEDTFDYTEEGAIMRNTLSPAFYSNEKLSGFLNQISNLFLHMVNHTKNIKRWFIISVDPDDDSIN